MISKTHQRIFSEFCEWSPTHASMVVDYGPWGSNSIVVWLNNGIAYKIKKHAPHRFTMQTVSEEDIMNKRLEAKN